mgnify:CR=1 FL=1
MSIQWDTGPLTKEFQSTTFFIKMEYFTLKINNNTGRDEGRSEGRIVSNQITHNTRPLVIENVFTLQLQPKKYTRYSKVNKTQTFINNNNIIIIEVIK